MANTVYVGLSGGVDSGLSAALLKERGLNVVGVFIKIWQPTFIECTWREDRLDAMRIAASLGIPFREIDLSETYKKEVIEKMLADYRAGVTPNPDVLCNRSVKFGEFFRWARAEGADMIATGHYARIRKSTTDAQLLKAVDRAKDQSYFLYLLDRNDLARTIFPVGEMTKTEVRARAKALGLPVAQKPDSQGLCFVGEVSMREFLQRYISVEEGAVLDESGAVIGQHDGAALYTIGQRHGFSINGASGQQLHYVIAIDTARNTLTVSGVRDRAAKDQCEIYAPHWISRMPNLPATFDVQGRYHEAPVRASIEHESGRYAAKFELPHIVSPGQALVMYDGDVCVGGAVIR